jgi:hypothetical protein
MSWNVRTAVTALALLVPAASACSGGSGSPDARPVDAGATTFSAIYNDIIQGSCAQPFCHLGITTTMPLPDQATAYMQLVNTPASGPYCMGVGTRVVPGHPETSIMYEKIERPAPMGLCGGSMPGSGRPALAASDIQRIREWILMGAKND